LHVSHYSISLISNLKHEFSSFFCNHSCKVRRNNLLDAFLGKVETRKILSGILYGARDSCNVSLISEAERCASLDSIKATGLSPQFASLIPQTPAAEIPLIFIKAFSSSAG